MTRLEYAHENLEKIEFTLLNNATGTTAVHADTTGSRFCLMGMQGAANNTGTTIQIQDAGGGTNLTGAIPLVANTPLQGFPITGHPYCVSTNDYGLQFVVSSGNAFDGVLQFMEVDNS